MIFQPILRSCRAALLVTSVTLLALAAAHAQDESQPTYRIVILEGLTLQDAQTLRSFLEDYDYRPTFLDEQNESFRVLYGSFTSRQQAQLAQDRLKSEGIESIDIVRLDTAAALAPAEEASGYSVFLAEFDNAADAEALASRLRQDPAGFSPVQVQQDGRFARVYVGSGSQRQAGLLLDQLRQSGYATPGVSRVVSQASAAPAVAQPRPQATPTPAPTPAPAQSADSRLNVIAPAIVQTELWQSLTEDQKRQVINEAMLATELRTSGDLVMQNVIDLQRRMENLSGEVRELVQRIEQERARERELAGQMRTVIDRAENLVRSREYQEALAAFNEALSLDPDDILRQRRFIETRIRVLEGILEGELYPGQKEKESALFERRMNLVNQLRGNGDLASLEQALSLLQQIQIENPDLDQTIQSQIATLQQQVDTLRLAQTEQRGTDDETMMMMILGLGAAVLVLLVLVLFTWMRTRRQQKEFLTRLHEITSASIRPIRELDGTNSPLLDTGSGTESDLFSPRTTSGGPRGGDVAVTDPLGGLSNGEEEIRPSRARRKGKQDTTSPSATAAPATPAAAEPKAAGDMDFDALFGGSEPEKEATPAPAAPATAEPKAAPDLDFDAFFGGGSGGSDDTPSTQASPPAQPETGGADDVEDIFGGLFTDAESGNAQPEPERPEEQSDFGSISFDDEDSQLKPDSVTQAAAPSGDDDLLAIFDTTIEEQEKTATGYSDAGVTSPAPLDDNDIPAIQLDDDAPIAISSESTVTSHAGETGEESAFSFDEFLASTGGTEDTAASVTVSGTDGGGLDQDFEDDAPGSRPSGWEGDYPYASLTVQADTPPRGSLQYLCFEKREGSGKACFSRRFAPVSGKVGIEFDLRCNDKNKFLLGVYIENDGDFQKAIHTKILRSEAQTTPTIHMQGESAPYLLGSWAHIKYVVDLKEGKLNSYIDNTHVGRDLPLEANPGSLNMISIRDNINTTGVLLLDNIKIYQIED